MRKYLILLVFSLFSISASTTGFAQASKIVALLKGQVTSQSGEKLKDVQVIVYKGGERINTGKTNTEGKFQIILQPNAEYRIGYSHGSYYYKEETLSIPASDKYQEVPVSASLKELEFGKPYPMSSLIFEPRSSSISSTVLSDLEGLAQVMKRNNKVSLIITVYPDETPAGKNAAKQNDLAAARKAAISTYLLSKNISNYTININTSVPPGKYERTLVMTEEPAATGKKKKSKKAAPAKSVSKKVMVPQYAEFVMRQSS
jgi:hypothetical protein